VEEIAGARKILGWDSPPFVIPEPLLREWREIGAKGREARMAWADRVKAAPAELRSEFERRNDGKLPANWNKAIAAARAEFIASGKEMATRSASGVVLDHLVWRQRGLEGRRAAATRQHLPAAHREA
jgi:transketolase